MNKNRYLLLVFAFLLAGCKSSPSTTGLMSLNEAIDAAVIEIESKLTEGTEIAVFKISAFQDEIGEYLCNELNNRFSASRKLIPLAREAMSRYANSAMFFVSDHPASRIMEYYHDINVIITGTFDQYADFSQLRLRIIGTETPALLASYSARISNKDEALVKLTAPFGSMKLPRISEDALAHLNRGKDFLAEGRWVWDDAILEFDQVIAINKKLSEAYYLRGFAYNNLRLSIQAIEDFSQVIRLNPNNAGAYILRGWTYSNKVKPDNAIEDFSHAIKLEPNNAWWYLDRGIFYENMDDHEKAIVDYSKAIMINPDFESAYYNRGQIYKLNGELDNAIADYTQVIRLDPNDSSTYYYRSIAYDEIGDLEKAIADAEASLRLKPDNGEVSYFLKHLRKKQNEH